MKRKLLNGLVISAVISALVFMTGAEMAYAGSETSIFGSDEISVDPMGGGDGYSEVLYDNASGLPTSEANAIAQTSEGFIWIGSYSGLIRYDGNTFERIDSTGGLASVVSLFVDSKNRLWVGTNDSGVAVMDMMETVRVYNKADGMKSLSVRSISEDSEGTIYIATTHGMMTVDSEMNMVPFDEPQINDEYIYSIKCGSDDVIYGITKNGSVFTIEDKKMTSFMDYSALNISDAYSITPDYNDPGYVYIGSEGSQIYHGKFDTKTFSRTETGELEHINSAIDINDDIWVCADNGIGKIVNGRFIALENSPMNTSVENMMIDYQGNLWFTSSKQGVMKIVPNQFTDIFEKYNLKETVVNSTCIVGDRLYIGSKNNGLSAVGKSGSPVVRIPISYCKTISGKEMENTDLIGLFLGMNIRSLIRDSKDNLWISTYGEMGLVRYDGQGATLFTEADGMPSDRIRTVYELSDGRYAVACTGGVAIINGDKIEKIYDKEAGINDPEVLTVCQDDSGAIVAGTDGGGIYVINEKGIVHLGTEDGLASEVIMRIKNDTENHVLWIVTSNSIAYMDENYNIHTIKNFPYSNNFDIYWNMKGDVWILSSNGVYVVGVNQLLENEEISPVYYGFDNGLPVITTANSYSYCTEEGDLYIAGSTGVAKVNLDKPFEDVDAIKMAVPYIEADGQTVFPDANGKFTVAPDVGKITIYSYVFTYSLMNPQVSYHLEGFDKTVYSMRRSEMTPADYTNLKGGDYTFVLELKDSQGRGNKRLEVPITKQKAFYETTQFGIFLAVIIAVLLYEAIRAYIRYRTRKYRKKEEEDRLLIREMVEAFAKTIDMKDKYTNGHSSRVAEYTAKLALEMGLDDETVEKYRNIALLHDIGKIGVPPEVLNKQGKLTDTEFNIIKSHSALGYKTLKDISIMPELAIGAGAHHERPDGKGYPKGLKGDEIPEVARIIAVADTFDAMYSDRPYRKRMNFEKVVSIMKEVKGTQLDPEVTDAFLRLVEKGEFKDPNDDGGGSTEDIDNIHKNYEKMEAAKKEAMEKIEKMKAEKEENSEKEKSESGE